MRRQYLRLFRVRNLVAATFILVTLYAVRTWRNGSSSQVLPRVSALVKQPAQKVTDNNIPIFVPDSTVKKDWHDYRQIREEARRQGIGEQGKPASLSPEEVSLEQKIYAVNGYNGALSDKISLNRSLPDIRHELCQSRLYIESLPTVSVVVPFHDEHFSTLLRTAASVIRRSPPHLLREILLVDDGSTKEFLKGQLVEYLAKFMPKARVIRLNHRKGLITARLAGAREAKADVLVFLDSHTEANVNWLPPLLEPIALNYRTAVCPFIDVIAYDTFEYRAQDEGARGAFDWEFFYKRLPLLPRDQRRVPEPFPSPVMAGGLFAISRAFFWELGGYDPGLQIWGGEQYELSFKIWQCGGRMLDAPCSRVGHIYRKFAPFPDPEVGDFVAKNYRRVADVWMDEYAQYLYQRRSHYLQVDPGDLTAQKALRKKLKCKSFRWFMTQIAFDLTAKYPPVEPTPFASGRIKPLSDQQLCVDAAQGAQNERITLTTCSDNPQTEQEFVFSWHKDIKSKYRNMCWDLPESAPNSPVLLFNCHLGGGNQEWKYDVKTKQLKKNNPTVCLDWDIRTLAVFVKECDLNSDTQKWTVEHVDLEAMEKVDEAHPMLTGPQVEDWY